MVKVYKAKTDTLADERLFSRLYAAMPPYRREKIDRMAFQKDKCLSLGAGVLLDRALSIEGINTHEIAYIRNQKPVLKNSDICFNLSHSGNVVFCAIADTDVGCDVEQIKDIGMSISSDYFSPDEYKTIAACTDHAGRIDLFFRYWTLKESFMKATGLGFELELDDFCIVLGENDISVRQSVDNRRYHFREYDMNDGYKYAVCCAEHPVLSNEIRELDFQIL
ncbi:MAG: 4'-phosphopantetheinyl transferase superfamily protein [Lachnospiraceae bacterium]|nr:4'-phosphopantetheinyl transferase superfamily protein [Lachnospiraceae bacterium]